MGSTNAKTSGQPTRLNAEAFASAFAFAWAKAIDLSGFLFSFFSGGNERRTHLDQNEKRNANDLATKNKKDATPQPFLIVTILLNFKISGARRQIGRAHV